MRFIPGIFLAFGLLAPTAFAADSLLSGTYYIINTDRGAIVGRAIAEEASLAPKRIIVTSDAEPWNVTSLGGDKYILRNIGAPAKSINGKIFVDIQDQDYDEWIIQRQLHSGAYTIVSSTDSKGWVLDHNSEYTQVSSKDLISTESIPPQFPPNELWNFQPEA